MRRLIFYGFPFWGHVSLKNIVWEGHYFRVVMGRWAISFTFERAQ